MKLWIDNKTSSPIGYAWCKDAKQAIANIAFREGWAYNNIDCVSVGDDGIELLKWIEETNHSFNIHIHSQDVETIKKIREIIKRNGWKEVESEMIDVE
jgi:hypothetical protein